MTLNNNVNEELAKKINELEVNCEFWKKEYFKLIEVFENFGQILDDFSHIIER